mmetsp:Transcript_57809/g.126676  ORF Transcript_57809/g.126676 Transcript_57809/m.126676 type:complete len:297 (-) Transcript_57809:516-1406(-)
MANQGRDAAAMAALVLSGVAAGGVLGLMAMKMIPKEKEEADYRKHLASSVEQDANSGIATGFTMEDAREKADTEHMIAKRMKPEEVLSALQKGNARFWMGAAHRPEASAFERRALISKQFPLTAVLGCSDSRVPVEIVFDQGLGDMFVVRVAGNCLDNTTTASLEYAVHHLSVKVLMVMGHEGCGAIKAAQLPTADIAKEPTCLGNLLTGLKEGLNESDLKAVRDSKAHDREAVTTNVKRQVEKLTLDKGIMEQVKKGNLIIVGCFYEISSGIVDFFHEVNSKSLTPGKSSLIPIQ